MSEMRMTLEDFAAGELDYAGLQRKIGEALAGGVRVEEALDELHAICASDGMSQGLYNVLRRAITRVGEGEDTDPFPDGEPQPASRLPPLTKAATEAAGEEPTDPDLPPMFTHPEQLLPDELPPDPLEPRMRPRSAPEIVLPDDDEALAAVSSAPSEETGLGADALITGVQPAQRDDRPADEPVEIGLPEPGDLIASRYVVQSVLGRGGMGVVYRALDRCREACDSDDSMVALKMLRPELQAHEGSDRRLLLEALQGQRLVHPNLVRILDVGMDRGRAFVTMELLEGELLRSALTRRTPDGFPGDEALDIIAGVARGLAYLHGHGFVHSDLKPRNIFLASDGQPKLLDFGISRRPGRVLEPVLDGGDVPARTPAYASPQILRGEAPGFRDDVFALACVAGELLLGRHPYGRVPADEARETNLKPVRIRGLTGYQHRTLERALSFRAARRPADADEFLREMGLVESSAPDKGPGFLQGALLGLAGGLLLTLAIISPDGPLQSLIARSGPERPVGAPAGPELSQPLATPVSPAPDARPPAAQDTPADPGPGVSIGGTFAPDDAKGEPDDATGEPDDATGEPDDVSEEPDDVTEEDQSSQAPASAAPDLTEAETAAAREVTASLPADGVAPGGADEPPPESVASAQVVTAPPEDAPAPPSPGRLEFETDTYEVDEGSAVLIARVVRADGTRGEVAFRWRTLGGSAAPDEDFIATDWQRTSMADGQTSARIFIPLVNDGLREGAESFYIELADPEGGATLPDDPRVRVVIRDDDRR